jgi:hypothetical protein
MSITNGQSILRDRMYQNRIKTGAIFEDLLLSQEKAGGQMSGRSVSQPYQNPIC